MATVCVIPARFQSSRFPGKLLAKAQGKTVLQRTFESAARCRDLDAVYVATDDERIAEHVRSFDGEVIWTSPTCKNGTERIAEAFSTHLPLQKASFIVNLQGDHPCTEPETIRAIVHVLKEDPSALASTAVCKLQNREEYLSPQCVKCVFDNHGNALYFSRSPIPYGNFAHAYGHIGLYCYRNTFFQERQNKPPTPLQLAEDLEQLQILEWGHKIKVAIVQETVLGVDTPQDLAKLEHILAQKTLGAERATAKSKGADLGSQKKHLFWGGEATDPNEREHCLKSKASEEDRFGKGAASPLKIVEEKQKLCQNIYS